jgi:SNF2 family DNA or RNA helicase
MQLNEKLRILIVGIVFIYRLFPKNTLTSAILRRNESGKGLLGIRINTYTASVENRLFEIMEAFIIVLKES